MKDDNKKHEIILKTVNGILYLLIGIPLMLLLLAPIAFFACAIGGTACFETLENNDSFGAWLLNFDNIIMFILIAGALALAIMIFNIVMKRIIKKYNQQNTNSNQSLVKVNKNKYLLCAYFLGIFGVHKFMIKDKNSGKIRLFLLALPILSQFALLKSEFNIIVFFVCLLSPLLISIGLIQYDITIAKSKIPDEKGMITI